MTYERPEYKFQGTSLLTSRVPSSERPPFDVSICIMRTSSPRSLFVWTRFIDSFQLKFASFMSVWSACFCIVTLFLFEKTRQNTRSGVTGASYIRPWLTRVILSRLRRSRGDEPDSVCLFVSRKSEVGNHKQRNLFCFWFLVVRNT